MVVMTLEIDVKDSDFNNITNKNSDQSWIVISDTHIGGNPDGSNIPNDSDLCNFLEWAKHLEGKGEPIRVKNILFNWNEIPGNDNSRLRYFIKQNYGIYWERDVEIEKIDDDYTIKVYNYEKAVFLKLNNKRTMVKVETDNNRSGELDELITELENDKLNIYMKNEKKRYERTIMPPSKIVLLGDILELWDPENSDRSYNIKRGAEPFSLIHEMKCDKIYVVGNHDQDLYELADILENDKSALKLGDYRLEVYKRHYPSNVINGILIGKIKYAFLHGHQFDKAQVTERINKKLGIRFDPLDIVQDMSNISIIKPVFKGKNKETVVYFIVTLFLLELSYIRGLLLSLTTSIQTPRLLITIISNLLTLVWAFLVSYVVLTPLVKVISELQGYIWNKFLKVRARDKTVKEVIDEGYYDKNKDIMNVDVVIFGHTHIAGSFYLESKERLFVNTGSWIKETDGRKLNTFAYIDNNGIDVLSWTGKKEEGKYVFEHVCTHTADSLKSKMPTVAKMP